MKPNLLKNQVMRWKEIMFMRVVAVIGLGV